MAMWAGGCIMVFSPTGKLLRRIDFPAKFITCPTWGGEDGNTLFITSGTDVGKVSKAPPGDHGGQIFSWKGEGVRGVQKPLFEENPKVDVKL
jgi:L-arabinonolactonase